MNDYKMYKKRDGQSFELYGIIYAPDFNEAKKKFATNMTFDNWSKSNNIVWLEEGRGVESTGWYDLSGSILKKNDRNEVDYSISEMELFCSEEDIEEGFSTWSEDVYQWELRDIKETQLDLQKIIIDKAHINITTCGQCGSIVLHRVNDTKIECEDCGLISEPSDFPDLNY